MRVNGARPGVRADRKVEPGGLGLERQVDRARVEPARHAGREPGRVRAVSSSIEMRRVLVVGRHELARRRPANVRSGCEWQFCGSPSQQCSSVSFQLRPDAGMSAPCQSFAAAGELDLLADRERARRPRA